MKSVLARAGRVVAVALQIALLAPAVLHVALLVRIFAARIDYPMDIEWMEGGALVHAHRLLVGKPIYAPPGQGFLAYPYPPGHYVALALVGGPLGLDYWSGRLVSILSFVAATALLASEVAAAAESRHEGLALAGCAVGACAASFPVVGGWYDVVRNDSLAIFLVVWGAWLLRPRFRREAFGRVALAPGVARCVGAGAVLTAAVFTKQTAVFFIAWVLVFSFARHRRAALLAGLATGALSIAVLAGVMIGTRGWFWTYVFTNLAKHPVSTAQTVVGLKLLHEFAPFLLALPIVALALALVRRASARHVFWLGMLAAAFPAALLPFSKAGGFLNNLIPVALLACPVALVVACDLLRAARAHPRARLALRIVVLAAAAYFLVLRRYDPRPHMPTADLRRRAEALNAFVASLEGGVVIPNHPWLAVRNGHATEQLHEMGYQDAIGAATPGLDMPGFLRRSGARWALLSGPESPPTRGWVHQVFQPTGRRPPYHVVTLTGYRTGPRDLLERRPPIRRERVRRLFDFEQRLTGWTLAGNAFDKGVWGERGQRHVNTWHPTRYDAATGRATSPPFVLDRTHLGLWIAGGHKRTTRVELVVADRIVATASGVDSDVRIEVIWDVRAWAGQSARLVIVDEERGDWGHVVVDDVELFDREDP